MLPVYPLRQDSERTTHEEAQVNNFWVGVILGAVVFLAAVGLLVGSFLIDIWRNK